MRKRYTVEAAQKIYESFTQSGLTQTEYAKETGIARSTLSTLLLSMRRAKSMARAANKLNKTMANTAEKMVALRALPPIEMPKAQEPSPDATLVEALARENAALKRLLACNWGYSQAG